MNDVRPTILRRVSPVLTEIAWNDGHRGTYPSWYLRENCPCASCVEEFTGRRKVLRGSIPWNLERVEVDSVGNYAINFKWSDGHSTGIYTFEFLRQICPCSECLPEGLQEPPLTSGPSPGSFEV